MSSYKHFDSKVIKKRLKYRTKSSSTRFEMYVLKTNKNIVVVLYDKFDHREVTAVSTRPASFIKSGDRAKDATVLAKKFAEICKQKNITNLYFNKLNYKFHGLIANIVSSVRESGINI